MSPLRHFSKIKKNEKLSLVLDIGTTGVRACVFNESGELRTKAYRLLSKRKNKSVVEQDPREIVRSSLFVLKKCMRETGISSATSVALGITNQRETVVAWDKVSGKPLYPAIVWEDRRTAKKCRTLSRRYGVIVREKTGLALAPYFSATKMSWILEHVPRACELTDSGRLAFGTIDSWVLWNFLEGQPHITDHTNASRTLLFNIHTLTWDDELLKIFEIPRSTLPHAIPSQGFFGNIKKELLGVSIPIYAVCGDQQASMAAAGMRKGTTKITYGTGTFVMQNIGSRFSLQPHFFTTLLPSSGKAIYALEQKIEGSGQKTTSLLSHPVKLRVYFRQLAIHTHAWVKDLPQRPAQLIIDGGISRDGIIADIQQEVSRIPVRRQKITDGTALGVAILLQRGINKAK